jgi:hypothetical protein
MKSFFFPLNLIWFDYKFDIICVITLTFPTFWYVPNGEAKMFRIYITCTKQGIFWGNFVRETFPTQLLPFFNCKYVTHHKFNYIDIFILFYFICIKFWYNIFIQIHFNTWNCEEGESMVNNLYTLSQNITSRHKRFLMH